MADSVQTILGHLAAIPGLAAHTQQRLWLGTTPPELAEYKPSNGAAIVINGPGAVAYVPRFDYQAMVRVYGPSKAALVAVCDILAIYGNGFRTAHASSTVVTLPTYTTEPDTQWPVAFFVMAISVHLSTMGVNQWPQ